MKRAWCIYLYVLIVAAVCAAEQKDPAIPAELIGVWTGTWEGAGTGGFELTLEKAKDGKSSGRVSVTGEPTYQQTFRTFAFDGNKMTAVYDFPPDEKLEVALTATFDGATAKGTWSLREKAGGMEVASGTWNVKKK